MRFRYRAYNAAGRCIAGDIEASGIKDAIGRIKETGLFPVDVFESAAGARSRRQRRIGPDQLAAVTRQFSTLISTGTSIPEALTVLIANLSDSHMKDVLTAVRQLVTEGGSLAAALEAHPQVFSAFYRGLISSGETAGSLDQVLPRLADYLETRARIAREVRSALTYPALMTLVGAGVLAFLFIFVMPRITRIFEETGSALPLVTRALIAVTGALGAYWPFVAAGAALALLAARRELRSDRGKAMRDRLMLAAPFLRELAVDFYMASFTRTLGSLLKGGVRMLKALELTRDVLDNRTLGKVLDDAALDCTQGASLSSSLRRHGTIPPIVVHMIDVGERSGKLDEMLIRTAEAYEREFEAGVKRALTLMEPLLILAMGLVIGFIVLAILLPIFELNQTIR